MIYQGAELRPSLQISEAFKTVGPELVEKIVSQPSDDHVN